MTQIINGDLILTTDMTFNESIIVKGDIKGDFNLKVAGNIDARNINAGNINAWDINAWNIDARNIDARNIDARNIDAMNIDAWNIDAWNINAGNIDAWNIDAWNTIFCEKIKVKKGCKVICKQLITNRSSLERKEWEISEEKA